MCNIHPAHFKAILDQYSEVVTWLIWSDSPDTTYCQCSRPCDGDGDLTELRSTDWRRHGPDSLRNLERDASWNADNLSPCTGISAVKSAVKSHHSSLITHQSAVDWFSDSTDRRMSMCMQGRSWRRQKAIPW